MKINHETVRVISHYTLWALSVQCTQILTQVEAKRKAATMEEKVLAADCRRILNKLQLEEIRSAGD